MPKVSINKIYLMLFGLVIAISFQNCSRMQFSALEGAAQGKAVVGEIDGQAVVTNDPPPGSSLLGDGGITPTIGGGIGTGEGDPGEEPNDAEDDADDKEDREDGNDDSDLADIPGQSGSDLSDDSFPEDEGVVANDDEASAAQRCSALRAETLQGAFFDQIFNGTVVRIHRVRGSVLVKGAQLLRAKNVRGSLYVHAPLQGLSNRHHDFKFNSKIKNVRGPLCVVGSASARGKMKKIKNHRGYAEVANMSVKKIRNLRGTLVIRNSNVEKIINHRGDIVLIDSQVGKIRNQRGQIIYQGTSTVSKLKNIR